MLILFLFLMLLIGGLAAFWGFVACFFPARWDRFTERISFADRWSDAVPRRQHPFARFVLRLGQRVGGLATCAVGCWFAYIAASEIYLVLTRRAVSHLATPASGTLPSTPAIGATALAVFMIVAGILMIVFPAKAIKVFERLWPSGRSVKPSAAPKVMLFVRVVGAFFAFLAIMSLVH